MATRRATKCRVALLLTVLIVLALSMLPNAQGRSRSSKEMRTMQEKKIVKSKKTKGNSQKDKTKRIHREDVAKQNQELTDPQEERKLFFANGNRQNGGGRYGGKGNGKGNGGRYYAGNNNRGGQYDDFFEDQQGSYHAGSSGSGKGKGKGGGSYYYVEAAGGSGKGKGKGGGSYGSSKSAANGRRSQYAGSGMMSMRRRMMMRRMMMRMMMRRGGFISASLCEVSGVGCGVIQDLPYRGTGIGRLDRSRIRNPDGNRFPDRFRPDMIRPQGPAPTQAPSVSLAPSIRATTAPTGPPTTAAPTVTPATLAPTGPGATAVPTVAVAAATVAPTVAGGGVTSAPSCPPQGPGEFTVGSSFSMNYFTGMATDVNQDLTAAEYAELTMLMNEFYAAQMMADPALGADFQSVSNVITTMTYNMAGGPHIALTFDANYQFAPGTTVTAAQVLTNMQNADYEDFIVNYLMRPPANQLDNVQQVNFQAATSQSTGTTC